MDLKKIAVKVQEKIKKDSKKEVKSPSEKDHSWKTYVTGEYWLTSKGLQEVKAPNESHPWLAKVNILGLHRNELEEEINKHNEKNNTKIPSVSKKTDLEIASIFLHDYSRPKSVSFIIPEEVYIAALGKDLYEELSDDSLLAYMKHYGAIKIINTSTEFGFQAYKIDSKKFNMIQDFLYDHNATKYPNSKIRVEDAANGKDNVMTVADFLSLKNTNQLKRAKILKKIMEIKHRSVI